MPTPVTPPPVPRPTRVGWCLTIGGYTDERCERDRRPHDHHDVAIDYSPETGQGRPLYRIDPIGTTYLLPDGATVRLANYLDDLDLDDFAEPIRDRIIPAYLWWSAGGGASSGYTRDGIEAIWDGVNLRPGVWRTVPVAAERPAAQSTYIRPNGEVWRLRDWRIDLMDLDGPPTATWAVMTPRGSMTSGDDLPDDARLVWAP
jgi:hypothetical protein